MITPGLFNCYIPILGSIKFTTLNMKINNRSHKQRKTTWFDVKFHYKELKGSKKYYKVDWYILK